jgi:hypothetical protein
LYKEPQSDFGGWIFGAILKKKLEINENGSSNAGIWGIIFQ